MSKPRKGKFNKKRAPNTRAIVKSVMNGMAELKYKLTTNGGTVYNPIYSSTVMSTAYDCSQGTGSGDRLGLKIQPSSLNVKFTAYRGNTDSTLRFVVIRVLDTVSTMDTGTIFGGINDGNVNYVNNHMTSIKANRAKFEVLHDSCYILDDGKQNAVCQHINVRVNAKPVTFAAGSTGAARHGDIYFVFISDVALAASPSVYYNALARWTDI